VTHRSRPPAEAWDLVTSRHVHDLYHDGVERPAAVEAVLCRICVRAGRDYGQLRGARRMVLACFARFIVSGAWGEKRCRPGSKYTICGR
jgi:hypothetical protein